MTQWLTLRVYLEEKPRTRHIKIEGVGLGQIIRTVKAEDRPGYWASCYFEVRSVTAALAALGKAVNLDAIQGGDLQ